MGRGAWFKLTCGMLDSSNMGTADLQGRMYSYKTSSTSVTTIIFFDVNRCSKPYKINALG